VKNIFASGAADTDDVDASVTSTVSVVGAKAAVNVTVPEYPVSGSAPDNGRTDSTLILSCHLRNEYDEGSVASRVIVSVVRALNDWVYGKNTLPLTLYDNVDVPAAPVWSRTIVSGDAE
jgi:hypothetical protein